MKRKDFLKTSGMAVAGLGISIGAIARNNSSSQSADEGFDEMFDDDACTLVPSETIGPFPSLPSGDAMYWRNNITDSMAGVVLTFTIRLLGTNNCGVLQGRRVDVWHCNAHGYYSHYAASGVNNGHSGQNNPGANNASLIYGRGSQLTNANGEVTFTSVFPGWYPGRSVHIHFAIYNGGTEGSSNGWILDRISQFTFPITAKNTLLTSNAPYSTYGADPLSPANDNVFGDDDWLTKQTATLAGSGVGPYTAYFETAITATGILPLKLLGFDGSAYGQSCLLRWKTEAESNFSHFELEYSPDADDFEFLARINSNATSGVSQNDYVYEDKDRLIYGNAFYRLKMVDKNGGVNYSSVVSIHSSGRPSVKIATNPVTSNYLIINHSVSTGAEQVLITDTMGRALAHAKLNKNTSSTRLTIQDYAKGVYFLIYSDGQYTQTLKFVVQ